MNKFLSVITLLLISSSTFASAQSDTSREEAMKNLRLAKRYIVTGKASESFGILSDLWQESVPKDIRGKALYLSATLAEYGIGRSCNQPNALRTYEDAASLGDKKAKEALRRINKHGFDEPSEALREAIVRQMRYEYNREFFHIHSRAKLPLKIEEGFEWTNGYAFAERGYISQYYKIFASSPILAGANSKEEVIERIKSIPPEKFLKGWNIPELFKKMNLGFISLGIMVVGKDSYLPLGLERKLLPSGEEAPIKITTREK